MVLRILGCSIGGTRGNSWQVKYHCPNICLTQVVEGEKAESAASRVAGNPRTSRNAGEEKECLLARAEAGGARLA